MTQRRCENCDCVLVYDFKDSPDNVVRDFWQSKHGKQYCMACMQVFKDSLNIIKRGCYLKKIELPKPSWTIGSKY